MKIAVTAPQDELKTFAEWSADGYKIMKGMKATWVDDVPMFARHQVTFANRYWRSNGIDSNEADDCYGDPEDHSGRLYPTLNWG